jgi:hypothetical protein
MTNHFQPVGGGVGQSNTAWRQVNMNILLTGASNFAERAVIPKLSPSTVSGDLGRRTSASCGCIRCRPKA